MPQSSLEVGLVKHASRCDSGLSPCFKNCLAQAVDLSAANSIPLVFLQMYGLYLYGYTLLAAPEGWCLSPTWAKVGGSEPLR